jgi:Fe2+ transport system protein B
MTRDSEAARERKKAVEVGVFLSCSAVVFLLIAIMGVFGKLPIMTYVATGIFIALLVVGAMTLFAGERQRRRDTARRMAAGRDRSRSAGTGESHFEHT